MLRGCSILLLQEPCGLQSHSEEELRQAVAAAGAKLSIDGSPALDARTLTHVVAAGWEATAARAPSLAARHSDRYVEYASPRPTAAFVTTRWLTGSLETGRRLAEAEFVFAIGAQARKRRKTLRKIPQQPTPGDSHDLHRGDGSFHTCSARESVYRRHKIYLFGDENIAGDKALFEPACSVGGLLQARAKEAGFAVALASDGYAQHCSAGLQTQDVVRLVDEDHLDLRAGDIVVVATQIHDAAIAAIKGQSRVPAHFDARPVQMDYYPQQLVQKLRRMGVAVAYGQLTSHPELTQGLARSQQQQLCLQGFLTRLEQDHHRDKKVIIFDLFDGMSRDDWAGKCTGRHTSTHRYVPGESGQRRMAENIWRALVPFMTSVQEHASATHVETARSHAVDSSHDVANLACCSDGGHSEHSLGPCGGAAEELDVDDYEVKEEHSRKAEDHAAVVVTQVSFKQGEFTRDHEWMLELENMVDQKLPSPNFDLVVKLVQMAKICDVSMDECNPIRDKYRAKALKLAALKLKDHPKRLKTEHEVREAFVQVRGVGPKTTSKVIELVKTGRLRRLDDRLADPKTNAVLQFTQIFGVGPIAAQNFWDGRNTRNNQQIRTLDELKDPSNPGKLNDSQLWWLARLDDMRHKIPRREVEEIERTIQARCIRLFGAGAVVIACGSYRRGCTESSDVDLLLSHKDGVSHKGSNRGSLIQQLLQSLRRCGIETRELMEERKAPNNQQKLLQDEGYATWKGCLKIEQLDRRVDFLVVPYARIAPALIYFTGSGLLCRQMRGQAMRMGLRLNEKMLIDVRTGDEIHVKTERDVFEKLGMHYIEPGERDRVDTGFHYTKADRAKQLAADSQERITGNTARNVAAPEHALPAGARRRRLYLVGDQNLMSPESWDGATHRRLPANRCIGMLLQQEASMKRDLVGEIEVVLDAQNVPAHCAVGLQTQQVVRMLSQPKKLDLARGDIVVVTTQLWDNDLRSISTESKQGYDSRDLGRPERMGYDPRQLVEKLHEKGAIIAYGRLTAHPDLALNTAASRQKHKSLTNFFVRFEMSKETNAVKFFDLFEGIDQRHFQQDESATRAEQLRLGPKYLKRARWVPGPRAQLPMARNILRAVEELLLPTNSPVAHATAAAAAAERLTAANAAVLRRPPCVLTAAEAPLSLALTPLGINEAFQIPVEDGARVAIAMVMEFLQGTGKVMSAGGLRLWLYTGGDKNFATFESELAAVAARDSRLVLLASSIADICHTSSQPIELAGNPISAFVHEIDRRGRGLLKQESKLLEEATTALPHQSNNSELQLGLHARIKAAVTTSNQQLRTVAEQSIAYTVDLPPDTALGAQLAIAVRPPSMNADKQGLDRIDALVELRRTYRAVLTAFATHAGLVEG